MKFEYIYKPPVPGERLFINLPSEIITYFQIKGMTEVAGMINNIPFRCGLTPRGSGKFSISFTKELQKKVNPAAGDVIEIDLEVIPKPIKKPLLHSNPTRISEIKLVMQNKQTSCGQACVAMLSGKTIEQVISDMRTSGPTTIGQIIEILDVYKINHASGTVRLSKKNPVIPNLALLTIHFPDYSHWSLHCNGIFYDPEYGILDSIPKDGRITSFFEIYSH